MKAHMALGLLLLALLAARAPAVAADPGTTERVSVDSAGNQGDDWSSVPAVSSDGRYVAFQSGATNLVPGTVGGGVFVRDRHTGTIERVCVTPGGHGCGEYPTISSDGRYVAFQSEASALVSGDTNDAFDIFVRDRQTGTTERISVDSGGNQNWSDSFCTAISADGRYVAFYSAASNLVPGDTNTFCDSDNDQVYDDDCTDVFVHDRQTGTTERVSVDSAGAQGNGDSLYPVISSDGRYVAFWSNAFNLVSGDTSGYADVFVRDRQTGTTERVSVDSAGSQGNGGSGSPAISADGRYVAFPANASNLVPGDTNTFCDSDNDQVYDDNCTDVFVHDRQTGTTERVSVDGTGGEGNGESAYPAISADGRYVAFISSASNFVPGDTNNLLDAFVHDRWTGRTEPVSVDSAGNLGGTGGSFRSSLPAISADGRYVAFPSHTSNLVEGDTNGDEDVFVRDRGLPLTPSLQWRASEVWSGAFEGPTDGLGHAWYDPDFDDSSWSSIALPDQDSFGAGYDRFYRAEFALASVPPSFPIQFASDDGMWLYVNGTSAGHWGGEWRTELAVNQFVPNQNSVGLDPVDIAPYVEDGPNTLAVMVSNGGGGSSLGILDTHADLGDTADDRIHYLRGFEDDPPADDPLPSPRDGDHTRRYQNIRGYNSIDLFLPVDHGTGEYYVVAEVEDGQCDDSFEIWVGPHCDSLPCGEKVYTYHAVDDENSLKINDGCPSVGAPETGAQCRNADDDDGDGRINDGCEAVGTPEVPPQSGTQCYYALDDDNDKVIAHVAEVPNRLVAPRTTVTFRNKAAEGDTCGKAAVYNVSISRPVFGFWNWRDNPSIRGLHRLRGKMLTHVMDANIALQASAPYLGDTVENLGRAGFVEAANSQGMIPLISIIGNGTTPEQVLENHRVALESEIMNLVCKWGYEGVDIDFEALASPIPRVAFRDNFRDFINELGGMLDGACPQQGDSRESGAACEDSLDNDGDGWVNDGCERPPTPLTDC